MTWTWLIVIGCVLAYLAVGGIGIRRLAITTYRDDPKDGLGRGISDGDPDAISMAVVMWLGWPLTLLIAGAMFAYDWMLVKPVNKERAKYQKIRSEYSEWKRLADRPTDEEIKHRWRNYREEIARRKRLGLVGAFGRPEPPRDWGEPPKDEAEVELAKQIASTMEDLHPWLKETA